MTHLLENDAPRMAVASRHDARAMARIVIGQRDDGGPTKEAVAGY
jgi:hypothetical protein